MYGDVNHRYLEARVMSASPVELVRMLYGEAARAVREARRHLAAGDVAARSREISRAVEILVELSTALDRNRGGELARQLVELYDYLQRRLGEANLRQEDGPLAEAARLLETLSEAWGSLGEPRQAAQSAPPPAPERPPATGYGSFMNAPPYVLAGQSWSA